MATQINKFKGNPGGVSGFMSSPAFKIAMGALSGGGSLGADAAIAGGGTTGALLGGAAAGSPGISNAMGIYNMGKAAAGGIGDMFKKADPVDSGTQFGLGEAQPSKFGLMGPKDTGTAMSRRMAALRADPASTLSDGLSALQDPSVPDYLRKAYAEPLLQSKYFKGGR